MKSLNREKLNAMWSHHDELWRDSSQIISRWQDASYIDPQLLKYRVEGEWWEVLAKCGLTLLVTREYEHLVMALHVNDTGPVISYWHVPHPSGLAVDRKKNVVYVSSTRNPNQIYDLKPVTGLLPRLDVNNSVLLGGRPLVPVRSRFSPGCLYIHDLALIKGVLYANAVGQNAVVRLNEDGSYQRVWWPLCIETDRGPVFGRNLLQLNSIAAGADMMSSFFSASAAKISSRCPGHRNFPVNRRGVIFSGATREPIVYGLTRPHSARLYNGRLWVNNSGYGEFGFIGNCDFMPIARLPGWTRGLCFRKKIAFVGTSRVIPRFHKYAPGLDVNESVCGVFAVDLQSGKILGSLIWPFGNQIFAIDWMLKERSSGFPFVMGDKRKLTGSKKLFYTFSTEDGNE